MAPSSPDPAPVRDSSASPSLASSTGQNSSLNSPPAPLRAPAMANPPPGVRVTVVFQPLPPASAMVSHHLTHPPFAHRYRRSHPPAIISMCLFTPTRPLSRACAWKLRNELGGAAVARRNGGWPGQASFAPRANVANGRGHNVTNKNGNACKAATATPQTTLTL